MERKLPFPLSKRHKRMCKANWKKRGLIFTDEEFEYIYDRYIYSINCELCGKEFANSRDRQMEHDHKTGKFRNICCKKCNQHKKDVKINTINKSGEKFICKLNRKDYKLGYCFSIQINRDGKLVLRKATTTLEKAIKIRDDFIKENPGIYT